jgi:hypothetical protein
MSSSGSDHDLAVRKMPKAAVVIHLQMREQDPLNVARPHAERAQLRSDLLFRRDSKADLPADIRMERARVIEQMLALPRYQRR